MRWKLVGNAVTVPVAKWIGNRLIDPGSPVDVERWDFDGRVAGRGRQPLWGDP